MINLMFLRLSYSNLMRRKPSTFVNVFLLVLVMLIIFMSFSTTKSINNAVEDMVLNDVNFRTLNVSLIDKPNQALLDEFNSIENVIETYPNKGIIGGNISRVSGIPPEQNKLYESIIIFQRGMTNQPNVLFGRNFKEGEKNVGLIPENFYPKDLNGEFGLWSNDVDFIDGKSLIGKEITIKYYAYDYERNFSVTQEFDYTFEVIGVYNAFSMSESSRTVFVPYGDVVMIKNHIEEHTVGSSAVSEGITVIVDKSDNVARVKDRISDKGYRAMNIAHVGGTKDILFLVNFVGIIIGGIILILGFIIISSNTSRSVKKRTSEIGLLKAMGYSDEDVVYCIFYEILFVGIISLAVTMVISTFLMISINYFIRNYVNLYHQNIRFTPSVLGIAIVLVIGFLVPYLAGQLAMRQTLEIEPKDALSQ